MGGEWERQRYVFINSARMMPPQNSKKYITHLFDAAALFWAHVQKQGNQHIKAAPAHVPVSVHSRHMVST